MMAWNLAQFAQVGIGILSHPKIVGMKAFHHRILGEAHTDSPCDGCQDSDGMEQSQALRRNLWRPVTMAVAFYSYSVV